MSFFIVFLCALRAFIVLRPVYRYLRNQGPLCWLVLPVPRPLALLEGLRFLDIVRDTF